MAKTHFKGSEVNTIDDLPTVGSKAPGFILTGTALQEIKLSDFNGKTVILNIFPSVDTSVCAASVRKFNEAINNMKDAVCLCVSADLPFAHARFCGAEGLENVIGLSNFKNPDFGKSYGVLMTDGPLAGLLARAVIIIDKSGKVVYTKLVNDITNEPDYSTALNNI